MRIHAKQRWSEEWRGGRITRDGKRCALTAAGWKAVAEEVDVIFPPDAVAEVREHDGAVIVDVRVGITEPFDVRFLRAGAAS